MAHPAGDRGRDSELFQPDGKPFIAFQYSIRKDWKQKISQTATRLGEEFPSVRILIYMSNQQIGGQADELKRTLLEDGLSLDVRDRNWFLERATLGVSREHAAEQLIDRIARPYLSGERVINKPSSALSSGEARAALLYLGLQWRDDMTEKGLTKLSFDALMRAALRHTHSNNRIHRSKVHKTIHDSLPSADQDLLSQHIDSALARLTKRYIRHWQKEDEFCLTYDEHQRILARLAEKENEEAAFYDEVTRHCEECLIEIEGTDATDLSDLQTRIPRVIEKFLLRRGEAFVSAVISDNIDRVGFEHLTDIVMEDLSCHRPEGDISHHLPKIVSTTVRSLLVQPRESTQQYLRRLSNSYTLFSFLRETPDVQSATRKLFSHGTVWLDTTVLLPVFAEQLEEAEAQRRFSRLFQTCREVGIELCVTPGVILEINSHMNTALACSQYSPSSWRGRTPYLYYQYLHTGKPASEFSKWLSLFRGTERAEEDISQFLSDMFGVRRVGLSEETVKVDDDLRWAAGRLWAAAHQERRRNAQQIDAAITRQLIEHDLETYLGVIALRQEEQVTELGYRHWLLTLDKIAWQIRDRLREEFAAKTPPSPLLSLDFLVKNLTFGPERRHLTRSEEQSLPIVLDIEMSESMPQDILQIADQVRRDNEGLPEYVIRRKVRDEIDKARRRRGCFGNSSIFDTEEAESGSPSP
ncbi:hypothetical protein KAT59_02170, partial [Candidatus Bipolaricaulota bacterium]|nr:hypothetical protein [Candidatus Bipolaricaulota bacterium]